MRSGMTTRRVPNRLNFHRPLRHQIWKLLRSFDSLNLPDSVIFLGSLHRSEKEVGNLWCFQVHLILAVNLEAFSSVPSLSCVYLRPHGLQHARPPCPSPTPGVYWNSCPLSWWCHPTISSSVIPFSSHLQSFPASGSFQMSQLFTSGGQSIGPSSSASVLPMNIQDWFPSGWIDWISLLSKGLSRVFSSTAVQKHQFFGTLSV